MVSKKSHAIASMIGGAIGDALGMDLEIFPESINLDEIHNQVLKARSKIIEKVIDYKEGGPWKKTGLILQAGEWTDDTSMMLCLADSILINKSIDIGDLMLRFVLWWSTGYNSCNGKSVGLGGNISKAIYAFDINSPYKILGGTNPEKDAGNGSLMRLSPIPIFWHKNLDDAMNAARLQTATTHNVIECLDGSTLMTYIIYNAINGKGKEILDELYNCPNITHKEIKELTSKNASWKNKKSDEIRTLPGRCLWSLEAALWCVYTTHTFRDALITAINLTGDSDTIASITGQIAGAIYGLDSIPGNWIKGLKHLEKIKMRAEALFDQNNFNEETMIINY